MAAIPFIPFYVSLYLADTRKLTTEEHGAYTLLIWEYWQTGEPLENDDKDLSKIVGMSLKKWMKIEKTIKKYFFIENKKLFHMKIEEELKKAIIKCKKASEAGKISAKTKHLRRLNKKDNFNERCTQVTTNVAHKLQRDVNYIDQDQDQDIFIKDKSLINNIAFFENEQPILKSEISAKKKYKKSNDIAILQFKEFYDLYPVKKGKKYAEKAFIKRNFTDAETKHIFNALKTQIEARKLNEKKGGFIPEWPHPGTWLNGDRWDDLENLAISDNSSKKEHEKYLAEKTKIAEEEIKYEIAIKKDEERYLRWKNLWPDLFKYEGFGFKGLKYANARVDALKKAKERDLNLK